MPDVIAQSRIVVVGGGPAGDRTCIALREAGHLGPIALIADEDVGPYSRPPLSKAYLSGDAGSASLSLREPAEYERLDIELKLGVRAASLDLGGRQIMLDTGETVAYDHLVIATGVRARRLPMLPEAPNVHTLRSLGDAAGLREQLASARHLTVIGAGFIGAELAAVVRKQGLDVSLVDIEPAMFERVLGPVVGRRLSRLHAENGVDLRLGTVVAGFDTDADGVVRGVRLGDGTAIATDVVVTAAGIVPNVEWLDGSGLDVTDGVLCDEACRAAPNVWAVGDVARWPHRRFGVVRRIEHWTNALEQGAHVAANLVHGTSEAYVPIPYFWSDQFDAKIQFLGMTSPTGQTEFVRGAVNDDRFIALYRHASEDRVSGVVGYRSSRALMRMRELFEVEESWAESCERARKIVSAAR